MEIISFKNVFHIVDSYIWCLQPSGTQHIVFFLQFALTIYVRTLNSKSIPVEGGDAGGVPAPLNKCSPGSSVRRPLFMARKGQNKVDTEANTRILRRKPGRVCWECLGISRVLFRRLWAEIAAKVILSGSLERQHYSRNRTARWKNFWTRAQTSRPPCPLLN